MNQEKIVMGDKTGRSMRYLIWVMLVGVLPLTAEALGSVKHESSIQAKVKKAPEKSWKMGVYGNSKLLEFSSQTNHAEIEEERLSFGVKAERLFLQSKTGRWSLALYGGMVESEFDYRSGEATLDLQGWEFGGALRWSHPESPRLSLQLASTISSIEGRDFVDHTTGTTGLQLDSELDGFSYGLEGNYVLLRLKTKDRSTHSVRGHVGVQVNKWDMNVGWFTNLSERMETDDLVFGGLSYELKSSREQFFLKSSVDFLKGGYELGVDLDLSF